MSTVAERSLPSQRVVIAVDPHKASWTAVVVTAGLIPAGELRVEANRAGYRQLRRFAAAWSDVRWAIEGAAGLGRRWPSGCALMASGPRRAREAGPPRAAALDWPRSQELPADALSVGIAA